MLARDVPATEQLLDAIAAGDDKRTEALIEEVVAKGGGVARPALSEAIEGCWRLVWSAQARGTIASLIRVLFGEMSNVRNNN